MRLEQLLNQVDGLKWTHLELRYLDQEDDECWWDSVERHVCQTDEGSFRFPVSVPQSNQWIVFNLGQEVVCFNDNEVILRDNDGKVYEMTFWQTRQLDFGFYVCDDE